MRFQFISDEKAHHSVRNLCSALQVSTSSYYAWCNREACQRSVDDAKLVGIIRSIFDANRKTYGSPRIHDVLQELGYKVGKNRVGRIMRETGIAVQTRRGWRCVTTKSDPNNAIFSNELNR